MTPEAALFLKRYRLVEQLGDGGSATVWRALDETRGHEVALKVLRDGLGHDSATMAWLRAEASAAAAVRHPAIVRLLEEHLDAPQPALAFEYVPGETLARRMARKGPLEPRELADIGAQAADALAHVHQRGLVHRDVKPSNILLGADGQVRLLDFGISAHAGVAPLDEPGTAVGTLPYVAPEQLAGQQPQPASDVYALGAVLYHAVSGRPPFAAEDPHSLAHAQQTPPAVLAGDGRALSLVALAALDRDARHRPAMDHLAAQLRALARRSDEPRTVAVPAVAASGASRATADRRRILGWPLAGAAGAVAAIAIAAVLALSSQPDSATNSGASPVLPVEPTDGFVEPSPAPVEVLTVDVPAAPDSGKSDRDRAAPRDDDRGKGKPDNAGKGKPDNAGKGKPDNAGKGKGDRGNGQGEGGGGRGGR